LEDGAAAGSALAGAGCGAGGTITGDGVVLAPAGVTGVAEALLSKDMGVLQNVSMATSLSSQISYGIEKEKNKVFRRLFMSRTDSSE